MRAIRYCHPQASVLRVRHISVLMSLLITGLFCLLAVSPARAQDSQAAQVIVNYSEVTESPEAQDVNVFFNVIDGTGRAIANPSVETAEIILNGQTFNAIVSVPTTPLNLVMVLDLSGSMRPAAAAMKQAAIDAVNAMPQGTRISLITFSERALINTRVGFTDDRNAIINAIAGLTDQEFRGGTCLYDATLLGIQQLGGVAAGRRALVLFTDGRDELIAGGELDPCSQGAFSDVLGGARLGRVPLFTIGLTGTQGVNQQELQSFAEQTGALSAFGDAAQLNALFQQIVQALNSQRVATARVCLAAGDFSGTLTLRAGSSNTAPITGIRLATTCLVPTETPTPTLTPTAIPLQLSIGAFSFNPQTNELQFEVQRVGDGTISRYRVEIIDADTNFQIGGQFGQFDIPLDQQANSTSVRVPVGAITAASWRIRVTALDANGTTMATSAPQEVTPPRTEVPTNTPTATSPPTGTPTETPVPLALTIPSMRFNAADGELQFSVESSGVGDIASYRIRVLDKATGFQVDGRFGEFTIDVASEGATLVRVPIGGIDANTLQVSVTALDADGRSLANFLSGDVTPRRTPTPTPTSPPTPTPTATVVVASLTITAIQFDEGSGSFVINLRPVNIDPGDVTAYTVRVEDEGGIQRFEQTRQGQFVNPLQISAIDSANQPLPPGKYSITVELARAGSAQPITDRREVNRPLGPPTPTPLSGTDQLVASVQQNPVVAGGVVLLALLLVGLLFSLLLRGRRTKRSYEAARVYKSSTATQAKPAVSTAKSAQSEELPKVDAAATGGATAVLSRADLMAAGSLPTGATLTLISAAPGDPVNQTFTVNPRDVPYRIGRGGTDDYPVKLNLNDNTLSANHATIQYANGQFSVVDDGSSNGTFIDDELLERGRRHSLENGQIIRLGLNSRLRFEVEGAKQATPPPAAPAPMPVASAPMSFSAPTGAPPRTGTVEGIPAALNARLTIMQSQDVSKQPGQTFAITQREYTIGRAPGNDLVIEADGISKQHAMLRYTDIGFVIIDNNSRNGTTVNNSKVQGGPMPLAAGKEHNIMLGLKTKLQFTYNNLSAFGSTMPAADATQIESPMPAASENTMVEMSPPMGGGDAATMVDTPVMAPRQPGLPMGVRATLEIVKGFNVPAGIRPVTEADVTMGRSGNNVIVIDSAELSRNHAHLYFERGRFYIEDLGSGNGTTLDLQPLTAKVPQALEPNKNYLIQMGKATNPAEVRFLYTTPYTSPASSDDGPATMV